MSARVRRTRRAVRWLGPLVAGSLTAVAVRRLRARTRSDHRALAAASGTGLRSSEGRPSRSRKAPARPRKVASRPTAARSPKERLLRHRLLSPAEERRLARRARAGDRASFDRLVTANARLVHALVRNWKPPRTPALDNDDLFQEGLVGLMHAAAKFDPDRGTRFSTYATWWIQQALQRAHANYSRTVRVPAHVHDQLKRLYARLAALGVEGVAELEPQELADLESALELERGCARALAHAERQTEPLDAALELDDRCAPGPEELALERQPAGRLLRSLKERLDEREVDVLVRRAGVFGRPQTLAEIGAAYGVTRERVRQIERSARAKAQALLAEIDRLEPIIGALATGRRPLATRPAGRRSPGAARSRAKTSERNPPAASVS
ncbi:sigma-70 family RNA polymerase sigma factor [Thermoleophilum album]|uniref:sigma-70 family RNA polymerase sigma factor n=1 Tax=Thermoleophilum album TaxID=29539 RepID=UPI0015A521AF|nr:sigma-70 family RNA polymerase sigma factor [Thermoleophilum album]